MNTQSIYDVAIIGGGPAGSAAATLLVQAGRSVALIERSVYDDVRIGETLPPRARPLLEELGLYKKFEQAGHVASPGVISAWGGATPYANDFIVNPYGNGWHVDRARFDRMLAVHAADAGAAIHEHSTVTACDAHANGWRIALRTPGQPSTIACRFVIDASGRRASAVKRRAGRRTLHDRLVGVAAFIPRRVAGDLRTLIEAAPDGWWYSTPLPEGQVCVYMTDADLIAKNRGNLENMLREKLDAAPLTRARTGKIPDGTPVRPFAAMTYCHAELRGNNWLLAGDAASTWDPLSGQGICKALDSGMRAARAIDRALGGDDRSLAEYAEQTRAQFDNYLRSRAKYYGAEQRWPKAPFWRRRHLAS